MFFHLKQRECVFEHETGSFHNVGLLEDLEQGSCCLSGNLLKKGVNQTEGALSGWGHRKAICVRPV